MKLIFPDATVTIADDSSVAQKIRQGYSYTYDGQKIILGAKTGPDLIVLKEKLTDDTATIGDIRALLKFIIDRLL